jgi:hypothetical protein
VRFKRELKFVHPQVNDRLQQLLTLSCALMMGIH